MSLKIIYVDTPFWRAEVPRLSLFYGSIDYEDIRISREDFLSAKKNGFTQSGHYLPFRQIPVLIINNYLVLVLVFGPALVVTIILVLNKILKVERN